MQPMSHSRWICSGNINDAENRLPPELFRKVVCVRPGLTRAELLVTAMGIYEARLNGARVGDVYFCPGYTAYERYVQFQRYEVSTLLREGTNTLDVTVANGWWLGTIGDRNNRYGTRRGLRAELHLSYADGAEEIIGSDEGWLVTQDTPCRYADFYNGETIDFTRSDERCWRFSPACLLPGPFPEIKAHIGTFVQEEQRLLPVSSNGAIFDFGQNHAGLLLLSVVSRRGAVITVRHAELLDGEGKLYTANLRGARQTLTLICGRDGRNDFSPGFTYMGFRYVELSADSPFQVSYIASRVLTSDCAPTGRFSCSDPLLNRLQENIQWSQRSNFLEIPTDCPQRDERMGWTGDIAVFAGTAAFNRDIRGFMRKWLYDLSLYQRPDGAIPVTIPEIDTYAPTREPIPIALWGDAATMVPWALWMAYGDEDMLVAQYDGMRACVDAELRVASATGSGPRRYIWDENEFQYGDWCAPGMGYEDWIARGKYLATAFMANSVDIARKAAGALGRADDEAYYAGTLGRIREAYAGSCVREDGTLSGDFESNYACALAFGLIPENLRRKSAARLAELVRGAGYTVRTGFAGTPYILFALADNGFVDDAYRLLQNEDCPGWLYTVRAGATTMWERWDALDAGGQIRDEEMAGMASFNHYAYGAVGDFLYRRVLGLEPLTPGYGRFRVQPVPGGTLRRAQGGLKTQHGTISLGWERQDDVFTLEVSVPEACECRVVLPDGTTSWAGAGGHRLRCECGKPD